MKNTKIVNIENNNFKNSNIENVKINLHIIDNCNYSCKHCFAKFGSKSILPLKNWKEIIDNCIENSNVTEFNIAGGEPMLHPELMDIVKYIRSKDKRCSLITNGILMNEEWIINNAQYFNMIGFSIDSFDEDIMDAIGRRTRVGNKLTLTKFSLFSTLIKKYNKDCIIKANTVVTSINFKDNIAKYLTNLNVDKWKILKMRIFSKGNFDNSSIAIIDAGYHEFCEINTNITPNNSNMSEKIKINSTEVIIEKETQSAYILIDSNGNLLDNSNSENYTILGSCINEKFDTLFNDLNLDKDLYESRYKIA